MTNTSRILCLSLLVLACLLPWREAVAAQSAWTKTPGARIRLLVDPPATASATVWGAIEIMLTPEWKTYWKEPGDTGVPPTLSLSGSTNIAGATVSFPPPGRHVETGYIWAGYERPVSFPVTITLSDPAKPARLKGSVFLGVCHDICLPVQAAFDVPIVAGASDPLAHTLVTAARASLPAPASADFGLVSARRDGGNVTFTAQLPRSDVQAELFVSGGDALIMGTPKRSADVAEGRATFVAPITGGSHAKDTTPLELSYTITQGERSVAGTVTAR